MNGDSGGVAALGRLQPGQRGAWRGNRAGKIVLMHDLTLTFSNLKYNSNTPRQGLQSASILVSNIRYNNV